MCAIESSRRHKCIILEQHAITSPHNFSAVCSVEEKKKEIKAKTMVEGETWSLGKRNKLFVLSHSTNSGGILTGREDWVWQRTYIYLSTSSSPPLHFPITARFYRMLCFSPQDQPPICFSKVKPTQSGKIKGFLKERFCWRVQVLWYSRWPLQALDCR